MSTQRECPRASCAVVYEGDLPMSTRLVGSWIACAPERERELQQPSDLSTRGIAADLGMSLRTVGRALAQLIERGWVEVEAARRHESNRRYRARRPS